MTLKARNWLLIAVVMMFLIGIRAVSSRPIDPVPYFSSPVPTVIAHQGGDGLRPGNTMVAFEHAWALGSDVLEMDVRATRDGAVVVIHDDRLDRTTDLSGRVTALSLSDVRMADAGYWWPAPGGPFPYRGKGLRVPSLEEVVAAFPDAKFNIEIKQSEPPIGAAVCAVLKEANATDRALIAAVRTEAMADFRAACPQVATSASEPEVLAFMLLHRIGLVRLYGPAAHALQIPVTRRGFDLITSSSVADAARRGMHVDAWTINDVQDMVRMREMGVTGIITDYPDRLLALLGRGDDRRSNASAAVASSGAN